MEGQLKYSCNMLTETLDWIEAIIGFLQPYRFLFEAHVINFFKDKLWEAVNQEWLECLCNAPVEHILQIPSGFVLDNWPASLKEFILTSRSLVFPREQVKLTEILPDTHLSPLSCVLSQGMCAKKKHEVQVLAAVISSIARSVMADVVVDVGAGHGYLAQVLSFQYRLPVVAIDASSQHCSVTKERAQRIKKHYEAKIRKSTIECERLLMPKSLTCRVLSSGMLKNLANFGSQDIEPENAKLESTDDPHERSNIEKLHVPGNGANANGAPSLVLAGLHACGDLSATMLRTFVESEDVRAVISVGCCYNLLSEEIFKPDTSNYGFPMSHGIKSSGLKLGKRALDLACQSAERWSSLEEEDAVENFDLHAFRALFQILLQRYYPEVLATSPSIGRKGKAMRRHEQQRKRHGTAHLEEDGSSLSKMKTDKFHLFEKFCQSGLSQLRLLPAEGMDLLGIWKEYVHFAKLIGAYWSLRAVLGPLLETLVLLDRVLFLQEQRPSDVIDIVPIFDPVLSPRNMAIIARKK
ncbi:hypothetical protein Drorol1_Dr00002687 [Drosera rotundifolia]